MFTVGVLAFAVGAAPVQAQPGPVDRVSVRASIALEEFGRVIQNDEWTVRHDGPWLFTNDEWTNPAQVTYFPTGTAYWVGVVVDECASCEFELRFHDAEAEGYFPLTEILKVEFDGSLVTASGRFEVDRDMRGELYVQMTGGADLYPTYLVLVQTR